SPQVCTDFQRMVCHALGCHRVAHDHGAAGAHDAGLLPADAFAVGAQVFDVVNVDAGDDGAVGINDVRGVEATAQTHFENRHIQQRVAHQPQDGQRGELEVRQRYFVAI